MPEVDGGALVARVLGEQRVTHLFAINGGHTFPILACLKENGVKLIHMRHEQAAAYAADGWARSTGRPECAASRPAAGSPTRSPA
jgi:acetolactate synthase-1/2/3 large subunit